LVTLTVVLTCPPGMAVTEVVVVVAVVVTAAVAVIKTVWTACTNLKLSTLDQAVERDTINMDNSSATPASVARAFREVAWRTVRSLLEALPTRWDMVVRSATVASEDRNRSDQHRRREPPLEHLEEDLKRLLTVSTLGTCKITARLADE
jgi:hypothetical protein